MSAGRGGGGGLRVHAIAISLLFHCDGLDEINADWQTVHSGDNIIFLFKTAHLHAHWFIQNFNDYKDNGISCRAAGQPASGY